MQFKLGLFLIVFSLISTAQAVEKEALLMDLIELLGELNEDDIESLDHETLDAAMHDVKASTNKQMNEPRRTNEVGGQ